VSQSRIFKVSKMQWKKISQTFHNRCVLSLIAQTKIFSPRFPISLLHSSHLSCTRRKPHLVWRGVHPAVCGERPKIHDFSKNAGDVPLWKIVSRDLLGRFQWEYACWKGHIVYFEAKIWKLEFTVFTRFWDDNNIRYVISFMGPLVR
jgi:hypothetical protein